MNTLQPTRRDILRIGAATSLATLTATMPGCGDDAAPARGRKAGKAAGQGRLRNVIFMVSDGMSAGVPTLAEPLSQLLRGPGRSTYWRGLMSDRQATHGLLATASLNSMVTDSAAAASAWGSGSRVHNGVLNILPDGTKLTPLTTLLHEVGMGTGLVTTDLMCGATPAGFAAAVEKRGLFDQIAPQYAQAVDVLMGGGRVHFDPLTREDRRDLIGDFQRAGYDFVTVRDEVIAKPPTARGKVLGLFAQEQMPYTIDHVNSEALRASTPTLAEMSRHALAILDRNPRGFFVMIEGARIDHAAHACDAAALLHDQLAFDDAIGDVLHFLEGRDDTLLVISSDHGNSNPGLCGMGDAYAQSTACFQRLKGAKASFGVLHKLVKPLADRGDTDAVAAQVLNLLGIELSNEEASALTTAIGVNHLAGELWSQHRSWFGALSQVLANHTGISFTGHTHTADHVILTALGPGAEQFAGLTPHPDFFRIVCASLGLVHRNPSAEAPAAAEHAA
jgi:alkaline phosphatase